VSDISLGPGIGVALGAFLTLAAGGILLVIALLAGLLSPPGSERRAARALRFSAGPLACLAAGALFLGLASLCDNPGLERLDAWSLTVPVVGIAAAATTAIALSTARRARRAPAAEKVVVRGAALAGVVSLLLAALGDLILPDWTETRHKLLVAIGLPLLAALTAGLAGALARRQRPAATPPAS
jgi:hypothetical protein